MSREAADQLELQAGVPAEAVAGPAAAIDFPESAKAINGNPIATRTKAPQPALPKEFVQLVVSPQGKGALAAAGFEAP
ncbi:hypothetical protein OG979_34825 [Actinomadura citrea]|uniref:hypothetical protein n=1 Tax=Actinomadura citrea TaxID=46158 RepID=UPI002E2ACBB2|nr:hypothetical protein [Actinomadura citrea]